MRTIGIVCVLLAVGVVVADDCRRVTTVKYATSYYPTTTYGYYYPSVGVGYNPAGEQNEVILKLFDAYKKSVEEKETMYKALLAKGADVPLALKTALAPPSPGLKVLVDNCSSCHDQSAAKAKGGSNVFFKDGAFVDEGENMSRVMSALKTGKMGSRDLPKLAGEQKLDAVFYLTMELVPPTEVKK